MGAAAWAAVLIGAGAAAGVVWLVASILGGLVGVAALADPRLQIAAAAAVPVLVALFLAIGRARRMRRRRRLVQAVLSGAAGPEVERVAARLGAALAALGRLGPGAGDLPWYLLIGPPGTGKTTLLANAGLRSPAHGDDALKPLPGVGGTRDADWWITDEAVIVDTAGRYATQDSDPVADRAAWIGFLAVLRRDRAEPLSGILAAVAADDLIAGDPEAIAAQLAARVAEAESVIGGRLPIYVIVTKADRLAGFVETFDPLDAAARGQAWGVVLHDPSQAPATVVDGAVLALAERLDRQAIDRVSAEPDPARRGAIWEFPRQLATLAPLAAAFVERLSEQASGPHRIRGVYLTSATQEGTAIDRLRGALGQILGPGRGAAVAPRGPGRAYFIARALREGVFPDAPLARAWGPRAAARRRATLAAVLALGVFGAAGLGYLGAAWLGNHRLVEAVRRDTAAVAEAAAEAAALDPALPIAERVVALRPALDAAAVVVRRIAATPPLGPPGLDQRAKLLAAASAVQRRMLNGILLPALVDVLEGDLAADSGSVFELYEALETYLALGGHFVPDPAAIRSWADRRFGDPALAAHAATLVSGAIDAVALDGPLIDRVRTRIREEPPAQRVYAALRRDPSLAALPPWRPSDLLGASAMFLDRASGQPLTAGIDPAFTGRGFHEVILPRLVDATAMAARADRVLGEEGAGGTIATERLAADVLGLYLDDYAVAWDRMLADLRVAAPADAAAAEGAAQAFGAADSSLLGLLVSVVGETALTARTPPPDILAALARSGVATDPPAWAQIDDRFAALRALVGEPAAVDALAAAVEPSLSLGAELDRVADVYAAIPDAAFARLGEAMSYDTAPEDATEPPAEPAPAGPAPVAGGAAPAIATPPAAPP